MSIFDELLHRLSSKTRIRQLMKDIHHNDLDRILLRMKDVLAEKQEYRNQEEERRNLKNDNIEAIKKIIAAHGLSIGDLGISGSPSTKQRRTIQKYIFQYEKNGGEQYTWEGATTGRLPQGFQEYLKRTGKKRMDCVIEEEL